MGAWAPDSIPATLWAGGRDPHELFQRGPGHLSGFISGPTTQPTFQPLRPDFANGLLIVIVAIVIIIVVLQDCDNAGGAGAVFQEIASAFNRGQTTRDASADNARPAERHYRTPTRCGAATRRAGLLELRQLVYY